MFFVFGEERRSEDNWVGRGRSGGVHVLQWSVVMFMNGCG